MSLNRLGPALVLLALVCLAVLPRAAAAAEKSRPNILFIYTDDHSYRTISCYPEAFSWVKTPNIDRLAERGVRFTHAYIGTWCMPSRATMLTGHLPWGVQSMRMKGKYPGSTYDPKACPFWPAVFRKNGYTTAHIGKWHTGTDTGPGRDWDHQVVWNRPLFPDNAFHYYYDQMITTNGGKPRMVKGYSTDNYTNWALEFINGQKRGTSKPWYLWLCYGAVHGPFTPADRHLERYPGIAVPIPGDIYSPRKGKPAWQQKIQHWIKGKAGLPVLAATQGKPNAERTLPEWVRQYHQGVLALDESVGRLMDALKKTDQLDNTLVVFTADQGFAWGQHGFRHKMAAYDATIRCPLIVSWPGHVAQGKVCRTPVGGPDLPPTFFHYAGVKLPWKMHGHDLSPLLENPDAAWPHPVLMALTGASYGADTDVVPRDESVFRNGIPWWVSLRRGNFKYIRSLAEGQVEELYDLDADPAELVNLALDPAHARRLRNYRRATIAQLRRTGAKMANNLPAVGTAAAGKKPTR